MPKKLSLSFIAFLQATGLVIYISLISAFFTYMIPTFSITSEKIFAPIIMLLLFIISAVISASLVLGRSGILFWEKKYKESFTLIGWTVGWGILYLIILIFILSR